MPDYIEITDAGGTKRKVSVDEIEGQLVQRLKMQFGADNSAADVSTANPLPVGDAGGTLSVDDGGGKISVDDGGGSLTVDGTIFDQNVYEILEILQILLEGVRNVAVTSALPAGSNNIGQTDPRGNVAHDGVDSGNPIKVGGRARTELPAAVSAQNDRADFITDKFGRQLTTVAAPDQRTSATLNRTNTESGQLLAALAEGAYVVTAISVTNAHATVGTKVEILDKETVRWKGYAAALGGGLIVSDPNGLFVTTKNQAINGKCATTGADVDIAISAYKIPA